CRLPGVDAGIARIGAFSFHAGRLIQPIARTTTAKNCQELPRRQRPRPRFVLARLRMMNQPAPCAVAASHVFDGAALQRDAAVVIDGGRVSAFMPRAELPRGIGVDVLPDGLWLAPGFIDLQVNGGGDVLFNDAPTPDGIAAIAAAHRQFGTTGLLPTLITDTPEKMQRALAAVQAARGRDPGVLG